MRDERRKEQQSEIFHNWNIYHIKFCRSYSKFNCNNNEIMPVSNRREEKRCGFQEEKQMHWKKELADLELQVQSQQEKLETFRNLWIERQKFLSKSSPKHHWN